MYRVKNKSGMNNTSQPKIWDTFLFSGEYQLLCARLRFLNEYCDYFVIVENRFTHSGQSRLVSEASFQKSLTKEFPGKIRWILLEEPNPTFTPWQRESYQRNQIARGLEGILEKDILMLSDLDEIPNISFVKNCSEIVKDEIRVAQMDLYFYEFDLQSGKKWHGTIATKWNKDIDFQELREQAVQFWKLSQAQIIENAGVHVSSIGDSENLSRKIRSFAHTEFNVFPFSNKLFLKLLIFLGICFDGSEVLKFSPIVDQNLRLQCRRGHRFDELRVAVARGVLPLVKYLFKIRIGNLSSPT